ncbi:MULTISPECIES: SDR family NAD(P)-dependent oxidoreductase [Kordiimonas]|uniref:SDR family NAD(P)-dependent oxidoreductase n=1 Tax=Kordiimonas TaxID=288021 RepID=UPI0025798502|nr:SDR family NAD(P)-dependent oxidoreductase [Kordiimonas sp. UBA4487]
MPANLSQLYDLSGKDALVTGGARGIGAVIAQRLADAGARVQVHYRSSATEAEAVVAMIEASGGTACAVRADLTREADVEALFEGLKAEGVAPDILVNNAGIYPNASVMEMRQDDWQAMFDANVTSTVLCTRAAAKGMKDTGRGGAIINIASISGSIPGPEHSHYNSAKAAVIMFTRSAAQELGRFGIRVNSVSPGLVWRDTLETDWPQGLAAWCGKAPLGRVVMPQDVAHACLFLASDAASIISGQDLLLDGGMSAAAIY